MKKLTAELKKVRGVFEILNPIIDGKMQFIKVKVFELEWIFFGDCRFYSIEANITDVKKAIKRNNASFDCITFCDNITDDEKKTITNKRRYI